MNNHDGDNIFGDEEHQVVAREALPILIELAKAGEKITYGDLGRKLEIAARGYPMSQMLGSIVSALKVLGEQWQENVPRLTSLVVLSATGYPSFPPGTSNEDFDVEFDDIYNYQKWDAVQRALLPDDESVTELVEGLLSVIRDEIDNLDRQKSHLEDKLTTFTEMWEIISHKQ